MKLLTPALLAASALAMTAPSLAQAQAYNSHRAQDCETSRQNRQVAGALIGGILGAVIGNELADDSNNNRRGRDHYGRGHGGGWGHGHRGRHDRYIHRDRGNAEEVGTIAGAGVGALIGAGIAGGEECGSQRHHDPYAGKPRGYGQTGYYEDSYYQDSQYGYDDGYYYEEDYGSSGELLGAARPGPDARVYTASSSAYTTGQCRWMNGGLEQMYMCQGTDGIWRPADTYGE